MNKGLDSSKPNRIEQPGMGTGSASEGGTRICERTPSLLIVEKSFSKFSIEAQVTQTKIY
jgi:hypothetical protein